MGYKPISVDLPKDIVSQLDSKRALVTGGTGMIGREVVRILLDYGCTVKSVSMDDLKLDSRAEYIMGDLRDFNFCKKITKDMDYVFHIAGIKGSVVVTKEKPASFLVPLLMMNTNILESCLINNVSKVLYTSSIGAYSPATIFKESDDDFSQEPMDTYPGWAKRIGELQIKSYLAEYKKNNFSIVRPSNIYGPGDNFDEQNAMVIPSIISRIFKENDPVEIWGDGSSERDFLHSTDAARGCILACILGTNGKALNLGCGFGISIKNVVENLEKIAKFKPFYDQSKPSGFQKRIMDMTLSKKILDFEPHISLFDGLKNTYEWYVENSNEYINKKNYFK